MPEIVRQHTHFHKVYKLVEPHASHPPTKWQPQPHVSLLGYTTTASGTGHLSSDLAKLISSVVAATPTPPTPNYGPALFDNKYLTEESASHTTSDITVQPAGKLLQQLFKPNVEVESPPHADSEPELEHNELLNSNFMAALQREYLAKFGSTSKPPKRKKPNNNNNSILRVAKPKLKPKLKTKSKYKQQMEEYASNYLQDMQSGENFDEHTVDDEEEEEMPPPTAYAEHYQEVEGTDPNSSSNPFKDEDEVVGHGDYDSAAAFSRPKNGLSFLPTPDEFLNDIRGSNSYAGNIYTDLYDDYGPTAATPSGTGWKTVPASKPRPTKPSLTTNSKLLRHRQRRRPALDFMATGSSGWAPSSSTTASGHSSSGPHHMRYPKLTNRSKRKNRIKSKTYRI